MNQVKCVSQGRLLNIHLCAHIVIAITHSYRCLSEFNRNLVRCRSGRIIITSFASDRAKWFNLNLILHDNNLLDIVWQVKRTVRTLHRLSHNLCFFLCWMKAWVGWRSAQSVIGHSSSLWLANRWVSLKVVSAEDLFVQIVVKIHAKPTKVCWTVHWLFFSFLFSDAHYVVNFHSTSFSRKRRNV